VLGEANVEATYALHATDIGSEVPDVLVTLMTSDEFLSTGIFLYE